MLSLDDALRELPLVAILRGITPGEAAEVARALADAGMRIMEVPLNSPHPERGIEVMVRAVGDRVLVGAGTVLEPQQVARVRDAGATLIVSPHAHAGVVRATRAAGLWSIPGFATASEAFAMLEAGAHALKLFPAEAFSPPVLRALRAVLPGSVAVLPVGGITPERMAAWREAGAAGFGLGSALYRPGDGAQVVAARARAMIEAWRRST